LTAGSFLAIKRLIDLPGKYIQLTHRLPKNYILAG